MVKLSANLSVIIIITEEEFVVLTKSEETPILAGALRETTKEATIKRAISSTMKAPTLVELKGTPGNNSNRSSRGTTIRGRKKSRCHTTMKAKAPSTRIHPACIIAKPNSA